MLKGLHHAAIICSDYQRSKSFYVELLGLTIVDENYQESRGNYKLDLSLPDGAQIELFHFAEAPPRPSYPEAQGLRHLAFCVEDIQQVKAYLEHNGVAVEAIRTDPYTGKQFTFFSDPDDLPLELYQIR